MKKVHIKMGKLRVDCEANVNFVSSQINLKLQDYKISEVEKPEILIAGCGTGQHSIQTAARYKYSRSSHRPKSIKQLMPNEKLKNWVSKI